MWHAHSSAHTAHSASSVSSLYTHVASIAQPCKLYALYSRGDFNLAFNTNFDHANEAPSKTSFFACTRYIHLGSGLLRAVSASGEWVGSSMVVDAWCFMCVVLQHLIFQIVNFYCTISITICGVLKECQLPVHCHLALVQEMGHMSEVCQG